MTPIAIQDLIDTTILEGTNITPTELRLVLTEMLGLTVENDDLLYKGSFEIGDVTDTSVLKTVTLPTVGTTNYYVIGSLRSNSGTYGSDNNVFWNFRETAIDSFKLSLREVAGGVQNLTFFYEIKKI